MHMPVYVGRSHVGMEALYFKGNQTIRGARVLLFTDNEAITPRNHSRSKGKYHVMFGGELTEVCAHVVVHAPVYKYL